jgi:hypothetical protein
MEPGANISQGPGQGEAAIVTPWRNPITPQLEMAAYQNEQTKKAAAEKKQSDILASIKGFEFKGLANHGADFIQGYNDIVSRTMNNLKTGDPATQAKATQELANLGSLMNANVDLKNDLDDLATYVQTNSGKKIVPGLDEAITKATAPLPKGVLNDPVAYTKEIADRRLTLQNLPIIDAYDPQTQATKLRAEGKGIAGNFADKGYEKFELPEAQDWVRKFVVPDPAAEYYYKDKLATNADLKKTYGDNWQQLAVDTEAPLMLVDVTPRPSKGININLPDPNAKPFEGTSVPSKQVFKIGRGFGTVNTDQNSPNYGKIEGYGMATESIPVRVTTLPVAKELGVSIYPEGTIEVDPDGNITNLSGKGVPDGTKFGQVAGDTYVATKTIEKTVDGKKFVIYKGEVVDPAKAAEFKADTGIEIPTEQQPIGIFKTGKGGYIYTKAASFLEPASLANYTVKGQSAAGEKVDKGFNKVMVPDIAPSSNFKRIKK